MRAAQFSNSGEGNSSAKLIKNLLIISIIADVAALAASAFAGFGWAYIIPIGSLLLLAVVSYVFLTRGNLIPAQVILPSSLFVVITYIIAFPPGYGLHDINLLAYAVVISLASLTLGQRGAFAFTFLIILAVMGIGFAEIRGIIVSPTSSLTLPISPVAISIVVLAIAFIQRALINLLSESGERAQISEKEVIERNQKLQEFSSNLENLVQARTTELDIANRVNEHRAHMFQAIAQVTRAIISTQNLQDLLPQITQVISQQFDFYHVGIFLLDSNNEFAVLSATNSKGGQKMLDRGHKLRVGQIGIVGTVAENGKPRIAFDVGMDANFFNNPDLPETRSEMALPLFSSRQQLIGVLDVQSVEVNAFSQDDIQILTTLTDQVSVAITNARLYEETQKALLESDLLYRRNIQTGWAKFTRAQKLSGIRKQGVKANLLFEPVELPGSQEVTHSGDIFQKKADQDDQNTHMTIPMKLRGEVVGLLNIKTDGDREWSPDEMDIINAIMERAALSIDNARLLAESRKIAEKERVIGEISSKVSSFTNRDNILQAAAAEIGRVMPGAEVIIQLQKKNDQDR
ncbi:MAG: GAF domain-containing protein [Anaerolineales bacterium]|uniref:GAF domain-containing protein n=1 Tax=Candidatus Villigracilis affinis TaxID=3140682 RepID=UPI001D83167E|nr:GAF domain-containing protein [Anaerolineales bacterium]MBK9601917.1 GAF domain-containing protein [Anaerolineales bacterium]